MAFYFPAQTAVLKKAAPLLFVRSPHAGSPIEEPKGALMERIFIFIVMLICFMWACDMRNYSSLTCYPHSSRLSKWDHRPLVQRLYPVFMSLVRSGRESVRSPLKEWRSFEGRAQEKLATWWTFDSAIVGDRAGADDQSERKSTTNTERQVGWIACWLRWPRPVLARCHRTQWSGRKYLKSSSCEHADSRSWASLTSSAR
nr:hypothetical protein CFP56_58810 [Quercus suber]